MADRERILELIESCSDPDKLRTWIKNAQNQGADDIAEAAFRRLVTILPAENPGTVEYDFWRTVYAFEHVLSEERGKTTRLSRTRQKVGRDGVLKTLEDWSVSKKSTPGFKMLLERGMPELTGEAIVLRHPAKFDDSTRGAAQQRLEEAGVDIENLPVS